MTSRQLQPVVFLDQVSLQGEATTPHRDGADDPEAFKNYQRKPQSATEPTDEQLAFKRYRETGKSEVVQQPLHPASEKIIESERAQLGDEAPDPLSDIEFAADIPD